MLRKVPLAANPNSAMLMTMKERWFHWLMEKTRVRSISNEMAESESRKTATKIMANHLFSPGRGRSWAQRERR